MAAHESGPMSLNGTKTTLHIRLFLSLYGGHQGSRRLWSQFVARHNGTSTAELPMATFPSAAAFRSLDRYRQADNAKRICKVAAQQRGGGIRSLTYLLQGLGHQ